MVKKEMVPETGEPQARKINGLRSTCGNHTPIDRKRLSPAPSAPTVTINTGAPRVSGYGAMGVI